MNHAGRAPSIPLLAAVAAITPVTFTIFPPAIVATAADLAVPIGTVQMTLAVYLFALAIAQPVYGPISDRLGRRGPLLVGLGLYIAGSAICGLAPNVCTMLVGRLFQAIGVCSGMVISRAIVRDWFGPERSASAMAALGATMAIAPSIGAMLGGVLNDWVGWRAGFGLLGAYGIMVTILIFLLLPETLAPHDGGPRLSVLRGQRRLLGDRQFVGMTVCGGLLFMVFYGYLAEAPFVITTLFGFSATSAGLFFSLFPISFMLGALISIRATKRMRPAIVTQWGNLVGCAGAFALFAGHLAGMLDIYLTIGAMVVISIAQGISLSPTIALAVGIEPRLAGTAAGLMGCVHMGMSGIASLIAGWLHDDTAWPLVWLTLVPTVLAPVSVWFGDRKRQ